MRRITPGLFLTLVACGGAPAVDGLAFEVNDVVYTRWAEPDGTDGSVVVLLTDATDICERGALQAGESSMLIYRRYTGSAAMVMERYDSNCELSARMLAGQGWVSLEATGRTDIGVDFVFAGDDGMLSGQVQAQQCQGLDPKLMTDCR